MDVLSKVIQAYYKRVWQADDLMKKMPKPTIIKSTLNQKNKPVFLIYFGLISAGLMNSYLKHVGEILYLHLHILPLMIFQVIAVFIFISLSKIFDQSRMLKHLMPLLNAWVMAMSMYDWMITIVGADLIYKVLFNSFASVPMTLVIIYCIYKMVAQLGNIYVLSLWIVFQILGVMIFRVIMGTRTFEQDYLVLVIVIMLSTAFTFFLLMTLLNIKHKHVKKQLKGATHE